MRKVILTTVWAFTTPALAGSAAEFAVKTCLPAMDDLGKVEVMARDNNWITVPGDNHLAVILPISGGMSLSTIAGILCTDEPRVAFRLSGARPAIWCTSSTRRAS